MELTNTIKKIENELDCNITIVEDSDKFKSYNLYFEDNEIYFEVGLIDNALLDLTIIYSDCEQSEENIKLSDLKGILKSAIEDYEEGNNVNNH